MNEPSHRRRGNIVRASLADLFERGSDLRRRGHCETACWFLDLAYRRAPPEAGDTGRAEIALELAWAKTECGAHREAAVLLESLDQRDLAKDATYVYIVLTAFLHHDACRFRSALEILRHGRTWVHGRKHPLSATLESREAALYADLGQVDRARRLFVEAIRSFDDRGASSSGHIARLNGATLDLTSGQPKEALEKIHEVRVFAGKAIDLRLRALLDLKEGEALLLYGDRESARKRLEIAETRAREAGLRWEADWGGALLGLVDPDRVELSSRLDRARLNARENGRKLDLATLDVLTRRAEERSKLDARVPPDRAHLLLGERLAVETLDTYVATLLEAARPSGSAIPAEVRRSRDFCCRIALLTRDPELPAEVSEALIDPEVNLLYCTNEAAFERALAASRLAIVHHSGDSGMWNRLVVWIRRHPTVPIILVMEEGGKVPGDLPHRSVIRTLDRQALPLTLHPATAHARYERFVLQLLSALDANAGLSPILRKALYQLCDADPPVRTVDRWAHLAAVPRSTLNNHWRRMTGVSPLTLKSVVDALFLVRVLQGRLTPHGELSWSGVADSLEIGPPTLHRFVKRLSGLNLNPLSRSPNRESILAELFDPIVTTIKEYNDQESAMGDS